MARRAACARRVNPWSVLGIEPTSDEAAIRRAYAVQLKLHRPQVDPEGFQRVREAYTLALHWAPSIAAGDRVAHTADADDAEADAAVAMADTDADADAHASPVAVGAAAAARSIEGNRQAAREVAEAPEDTDAARARLLDDFEDVLRIEARDAFVQRFGTWCEDAALERYDVRRALSWDVFGQASQWLARNAARRRALVPAPNFVAPLEAIFHWRDDELELSRWFDHDDIERMLVALDPTRAVGRAAPDGRQSISSIARQVLFFVGVLLATTLLIGRCGSEVREPPRRFSVGEPLHAAEAALRKGEAERAINLASSARHADAFERGELIVRARLTLGQDARALAEAEALRVESMFLPAAHLLAGDVQSHIGDCATAAARYDTALGLQWSADAGNALAWTLATCHADAVRDGNRAVTLAERAVAAAPTATHIDTLAAAFATRGDFDRAALEQQRALDHASAHALDATQRAAMRARLRGYTAGQPYRTDPPSTTASTTASTPPSAPPSTPPSTPRTPPPT